MGPLDFIVLLLLLLSKELKRIVQFYSLLPRYIMKTESRSFLRMSGK